MHIYEVGKTYRHTHFTVTEHNLKLNEYYGTAYPCTISHPAPIKVIYMTEAQ